MFTSWNYQPKGMLKSIPLTNSKVDRPLKIDDVYNTGMYCTEVHGIQTLLVNTYITVLYKREKISPSEEFDSRRVSDNLLLVSALSIRGFRMMTTSTAAASSCGAVI